MNATNRFPWSKRPAVFSLSTSHAAMLAAVAARFSGLEDNLYTSMVTTVPLTGSVTDAVSNASVPSALISTRGRMP